MAESKDKELSKAQFEAIGHFKGPALVIAGPRAKKILREMI